MSRRVRTLLLLWLGLAAADLGVAAVPAWASGRLVSRAPARKADANAKADDDGQPGPGWTLESAHFTARVRASVAQVRVDHVFRSESKQSLQVDFVFPLPPGAKITKLALRRTAVPQVAQQSGVGPIRGGLAPQGAQVDAGPIDVSPPPGEPLGGGVLRGKVARKAWLADVARLRDPSLIRHLGADFFRVGLPVLAPGSRLALTLTYEQTLDADAGLAKLACPLHAAAAFEARIDLETVAPLGPIYSPTHALRITRVAENHATIRYGGESTTDTPCLAVFWSTTRSRIGATLLTYWPKEEARGYYLMLAAPRSPPIGTRSQRLAHRAKTAARAKSISFVVDVSASMAGARLEGMRAALLRMIGELSDRDRFNIIAYDSRVSPLWPAPQPSSPVARAEATHFVRRLEASGNTNIEGALRAALAAPPPSGLPSVVLFLTDGRPTVGEIDPEKILAAVTEANAKTRTRIFVLGVGVDVNTIMLERLALDNGGTPAFVQPGESVETRLRRLYAQIRRPVLTDITFAARGMHVSDTVAGRVPDLFEGGTLVFAGRYDEGGPSELVLSGVDGVLEREFHYTRAAARRGEGLRSDFAARVWATRRIAALVDAIRLQKSTEPAVTVELVRLSMRYGILTEYTTFLAEESCSTCDVSAANAIRARQNFAVLTPKEMGGAGLAQARSQRERRGAERVSNNAGTWLATRDDRSIERVLLRGVRQAGNRTFYYRGASTGWVDACVDATQPPQATIVRWSAPFFALLGKTSPEENARLALKGPLLLKVRGRILRIVDPS